MTFELVNETRKRYVAKLSHYQLKHVSHSYFSLDLPWPVFVWRELFSETYPHVSINLVVCPSILCWYNTFNSLYIHSVSFTVTVQLICVCEVALYFGVKVFKSDYLSRYFNNDQFEVYVLCYYVFCVKKAANIWTIQTRPFLSCW